jgi:hypothetical protein
VAGQRYSFELTPKAHRLYELCAQGKSFDEAFAIADREYTSDGLELVEDRVHEAMIASGGHVSPKQVQL